VIGFRLLNSIIDPDCGCVEQEWDTFCGFAFVHLIPTGIAEVSFDNGDAGEWEIKIRHSDTLDFICKFISYINSLPVVDDMEMRVNQND